MSAEIYEQGFISSLLHNPKNLKEVCSMVFPKDISNEFLRKIYGAMLGLNEQGWPINVGTLKEIIQPSMPEVSVAQDLYKILEDLSVGGFNPIYYAKQVLEKSKRRELEALGLAIVMHSKSSKPLEEVYEHLLAEINNAYKGVSFQLGSNLDVALLNYSVGRDEELRVGKQAKISTHFTALDSILSGGFKYGSVVTIAAGSGVGKSTFGINILRNVVFNSKMPVMLVTLEMTEDEVAISVLASLCRTPNNLFSSASKADIELSIRAAEALRVDVVAENLKFQIWSNSCDKFGLAIAAVRRYVHTEPGCKLVMIDYLGLLRSPGHASKTYEIGFMMQTIKQLALELNIVILVLAQTNRSSGANGAEPEFTLDSLAHSAALGDTANVVMFIDSKEGADTAQIIVKKHRGGRIGSAMLRYHKDKNLFLDMVEVNYDN